MSEHYYTVGVHGPPTKETAPHGVMWRSRHGDGSCSRWYYGESPPNTVMAEWAPLPAPPTIPAPAPEPEKRWRLWFGGPMGASFWVAGTEGYDISEQEARAAADALNALDLDGVAWGPGRPMSELPDGNHPRVLLRADGGPYVAANTYRSTDAEHKRLCWWPLPLPGEAQ